MFKRTTNENTTTEHGYDYIGEKCGNCHCNNIFLKINIPNQKTMRNKRVEGNSPDAPRESFAKS